MSTRIARVMAPALVASMIVAGPSTARADGPAEAAAAQAQTLFDEGKALMQAKNFAAACPTLVESQALQPAGGTLLFLALCREGEGKMASAWVAFNEVLSAARRGNRPDREKVAVEHLAALGPILGKLSIIVPEGAARPTGLEVRRDGEVVPSALWGTPVPVDPGPHSVQATAPGKIPWEGAAPAPAAGATTTVEIPVLATAPVIAAPPPAVDVSNVSPPTAVGDPTRGRTQRIAGVVVASAGVVSLGVGALFGALALSKKGDESSGCRNGDRCTTGDASLSQTAVSDGNVSTVLLSVGAAAVVGGGVLWLTAPRKGAPAAGWTAAPIVTAHSAGAGITGVW
jgi:serine/threonine-protein kinase